MVSTLVCLCSALLVLLNKAFLVTVGYCVLGDVRANYLKTLLSFMLYDKTITISGSLGTLGKHTARLTLLESLIIKSL